jgi:hypothetical protein
VTSGTWPNLFIVGAARAGTTSLWRYLGQHPQIWMAPIKEPNFFSGVRPRLYPSIVDEAAYLRLFGPGAATKLRGEASPSYLWHEGVAGSIKRVSPDARIVIMLRDPVERAYSAYWHAVRHGAESRPFLQAVEAELEAPSTSGLPSRYVGRSFYADAVGRYLSTFPGAVHILLFEEFVVDVAGELQRVFAFLGVDSSVADGIDETAYNTFALPRNRAVGALLNSPRARGAARLIVRPRRGAWIERLLLKRTRKPGMDPKAQALLTALFAPDVERVQLILGRDLPWARP